MSTENDIAILLTVDGRGKREKEEALCRIIAVAKESGNAALAARVERAEKDNAALKEAWIECVIALETLQRSDQEKHIDEISPSLRYQVFVAISRSRDYAHKFTMNPVTTAPQPEPTNDGGRG